MHWKKKTRAEPSLLTITIYTDASKCLCVSLEYQVLYIHTGSINVSKKAFEVKTTENYYSKVYGICHAKTNSFKLWYDDKSSKDIRYKI